MTKPYIDIVLLCYGKFASMTKPCLDALIHDCSNPAFRLAVIDNASQDNSASELREYLQPYPYIRAVYLKKNIGFAGGMNYGATLAEAEWILLVSNDTIYAPGSLAALYNALREQPAEVGMVGPITNAAGNGQDYNLTGTASEVLAEAAFTQQYPCHALIPSYRLDFFSVAIRRSLWEKLHGLDAVYGAGYYEDTDFSMRAKSAGSHMLICEDAFVYHVGGATFASDSKTPALIKRNKKIFLRRHPQAVLQHKRQGNMAVLEEYAKLRQEGLWNEGLAIRTKLRIKTLLTDLPRSPIKKWLWQRKVKKILRKLGDV